MDKKIIIILVAIAVLFALVISVALIVAFLTTQSTGLKQSSPETQSNAYWAQTSPFAISSVRMEGNKLLIKIKNNEADKVTLKSVGATGLETSSFNILFQPWEEKEIMISSKTSCASGSLYSYSDVTITYDTQAISGWRQVGSIPIAGRCS